MMNYQYVETPQGSYIACRAGDGLINSEADALDLVGACGEYQAHRLLLRAENLPEAFYDLRTGLAGAVLLKFTTYAIKVAAIIPSEKAAHGRFGEMALEANRRNSAFHIFQDEQAAVDWLVI